MAEIISSQVRLPWSKAADIAVKSLKKRFVRSMITMVSVILAIAFLMSILVGNNVTEALKSVRTDHPNVVYLLQRNGIEMDSTGISNKMLWLICLSLTTCSVGIVNAMLMSVTERFREIGTMKCLGALDGFIVKLFIIEAVIQGTCGTIIGIVMGLLIGMGAGTATYGSLAVSALDPLNVVVSAGISLVVGVALCTVFAIYPAYVASRMQPVDAMRVEE